LQIPRKRRKPVKLKEIMVLAMVPVLMNLSHSIMKKNFAKLWNNLIRNIEIAMSWVLCQRKAMKRSVV